MTAISTGHISHWTLLDNRRQLYELLSTNIRTWTLETNIKSWRVRSYALPLDDMLMIGVHRLWRLSARKTFCQEELEHRSWFEKRIASVTVTPNIHFHWINLRTLHSQRWLTKCSAPTMIWSSFTISIQQTYTRGPSSATLRLRIEIQKICCCIQQTWIMLVALSDGKGNCLFLLF